MSSVARTSFLIHEANANPYPILSPLQGKGAVLFRDQREITYPAPRIKNPAKLNIPAIQAFIECVADKRVCELLKRAFQDTNFISFRKMRKDFGDCVNEFVRQLPEGKKATVAALRYKSSYWMAQLAVELGAWKSFNGLTPHLVDNCSQSHWDMKDLKTSGGRIVLFDDASYSGHQLSASVKSLYSHCLEQEFSCHLTLVVPYVSSVAINALRLALPRRPSYLQVSLITSSIRIPALVDLFSRKERAILYRSIPWATYDRELNNKRCFAVTEWRIADRDSCWWKSEIVSSYVKKVWRSQIDYNFFGKPHPPYRASPYFSHTREKR